MAIVLSVMMLVVFMPTYAFAAEESGTAGNTVDGPAVSKTITDNGDGTHTISLSVTGQASSTTESTKANVVIVFDLSNSMDYYTENDKGGYGKIKNFYGKYQYVALYKKDGDNNYVAINTADGYEGTLYREYWNGFTQYDGTRYAKRLEVAQSATASLIDSLAANNKSADDDTVEISFMSFATTAHTTKPYHDIWYKGNNMSKLVSYVMNVGVSGGTNWDDALDKAQAVAAAKKALDGDETYIIFVSDGDPTYYNRSNGELGGNGDKTTDEVKKAAFDEAEKIYQSGYKFYGVGVFGSVTNMTKLCETANGTSTGYYYSAGDQTALEQAFAEIVNSITNSAGYKDVIVTDNVTSLTSTNLKLVDGEVSGFTYTRSDDEKYTGPKASYENNTVTWNLGEEGTLKSGVTYTVSFKVWPSQEAYDLIADLKNGIGNDDALSDDIKKVGDSYFLNTNTASGNEVSYVRVDTKEVKNKPAGTTNPDGSITASDGYTYEQKDGKWVGTKETSGTVDFVNPDPIPVDCYQMTVQKVWQDEEGNPVDGGSEVTLELMEGNNETGVKVALNKENDWERSVFLAPGLMVEKPDNKVDILDNGHEYSLKEVSGDSANYSFTSNTQHPMLVKDGDDLVVKNLDGNELKDIGTLVGTNTLKPASAVTQELMINKKVTGADAIEPFSFELNLKKGVKGGVNVTEKTVQTSSTSMIEDGATETVYFGDFTFSKAGEYVFDVHETTTTNEPGWTYDNSTKTITVVVSKKSDKNELEIASISKTPEFVNVYKETSLALEVNKELKNLELKGNQFAFELLSPQADSNDVVKDVVIQTVENDENGKVKFNPLTYTAEGEYKYKIKEVLPKGVTAEEPTKDGLTYDTKIIDVTVTVSTDNNGELVAVAEYSEEKPTFTNVYKATGTLNGIVGLKILENGTLDGKKFDFTISSDDKTAPLPEVCTVQNDANGIISFGEIEFDLDDLISGNDLDTQTGNDDATSEGNGAESENGNGGGTPNELQENVLSEPSSDDAVDDDEVDGDVDKPQETSLREKTFTYKVTETGHVPGVVNDPNSEKTFTITIKEDGKGGIIATTNTDGEYAFQFNNVCTPASVSLGLTKAFEYSTGESAWDDYANEKFEFELEANSPDAPMPEKRSIIATKDHINPYFETIKFNKTGTYKYIITEKKGDNDNIIYDTTKHNVVVTVSKGENNELVADVAYDGGKSLTIRNTTKTTRLQVTKNLELDNGDAYKAKDATFYVALFSDPGRKARVTEPKQLKFVNKSEASVTFDNLPVGKTYYVGETDEYGKIIGEDDESGTVVMEIDGKKYRVEIGTSKYSSENFDAKVDTKLGGTEKSFTNTLWDTPIGFFKQFTLTKVVQDVDGEKVPYEGKFYVGIYTDPDCNKLAEGLKDGEGNELSNPIEFSFNKDTSKTVVIETPTYGKYYLAETDAQGNKVGSDFRFIPTFETKVNGEKLPSGNEVIVSDDSQVDVVLTNTDRELIDIGFDLEWIDDNNRYGKRGDYEVTLYANGSVVDTKTLNEDDYIKGEAVWMWEDLYKYDESGKEITYTVKESKVPNEYTSNTDKEEYGIKPVVEDGVAIAHLVNEYKANEDEPGAPTEDPNKGNDDSGDNITDDNANGADTSADDEAKDSDVQTGDSTNIMLLLAMMITSIMLGGIILLRARRKEIK